MQVILTWHTKAQEHIEPGRRKTSGKQLDNVDAALKERKSETVDP
jgi:hypothetical protein